MSVGRFVLLGCFGYERYQCPAAKRFDQQQSDCPAIALLYKNMQPLLCVSNLSQRAALAFLSAAISRPRLQHVAWYLHAIEAEAAIVNE